MKKFEKREIKEVLEDDETITIILNKEGYEELDTETIADAVNETILSLLESEDEIESEDEEDIEETEDEDALEDDIEEDEDDVESIEEDEIDDEEDLEDDEDSAIEEKIEEDEEVIDEVEEGYHVMPDGSVMADDEHDEDEEDERSVWNKKDKTEKRFFSVETRVTKKGKRNIIEGHAAVFNELSEDLGGFREKINTGAFDGVLDDDVRAFFNHDPNFLLARTSSGTLKLGVDKKGLKYSFEVPDTTAGRDLLVSMKRGDITQSSFAFQVQSDTWNTTSKGEIRTIEKVSRLFDVSPVSIPAYPTANDLSIAQRSMMTHKDKNKMKQEREYEISKDLLELKINILKRK